MQSLLNKKTYIDTLNRIDQLDPSATPLWGKMNGAQMLNHCQRPLEIAITGKTFGLKSNFLIRFFFKKTMYDDSTFRKNVPTPKGFKVLESKDFESEKRNLKQKIEVFHELNEADLTKPHPVFGKLTPEQWGKMQYKHIDHHLRQFGV